MTTTCVLMIGVGGCSEKPADPAPSVSEPATSAPTPPATSASTAPATPGPTAATTAGPSVSPAASPSSTPTTALPAKVTQQRPGWALDRIDQRSRTLDQRFTTTGQGRGVTVYVVDGRFPVSNAEFGGRASVGLASGRPCSLEDGIDHGLFVAGLVAGSRTGVAKQAKIVSVGSSGGCEGGSGETEAQLTARIVKALAWVEKNARKPAVVNLSLNTDRPAPTIAAGVKRLIAAGLTVVASAGNAGEDACKYPPAGLPSVITVAASTKADRDAGLNHGRCVDLFAPAEGVRSVADPSLSPNRLVTSDGAATSWAAPLVSGAAALYLSVHPQASPATVRAWIIDNATKKALRGNLHGSPNRLLYTGGPL